MKRTKRYRNVDINHPDQTTRKGKKKIKISSKR